MGTRLGQPKKPLEYGQMKSQQLFRKPTTSDLKNGFSRIDGIYFLGTLLVLCLLSASPLQAWA